MTTDKHVSSPDAPALRLKTCSCWLLSFVTKTSMRPALVSGPPPKSIVLSNSPPNATLPPLSAATLQISSPVVPPQLVLARWLPAALYSTSSASVLNPGEVRVPPPKFSLPYRRPPSQTLLVMSAARPYHGARVLPPAKPLL